MRLPPALAQDEAPDVLGRGRLALSWRTCPGRMLDCRSARNCTSTGRSLAQCCFRRRPDHSSEACATSGSASGAGASATTTAADERPRRGCFRVWCRCRIAGGGLLTERPAPFAGHTQSLEACGELHRRQPSVHVHTDLRGGPGPSNFSRLGTPQFASHLILCDRLPAATPEALGQAESGQQVDLSHRHREEQQAYQCQRDRRIAH